MKLVVYQANPHAAMLPGVLTGRGVVGVAEVVRAFSGHTAQETMQAIIDNFDQLRPVLEQVTSQAEAMPLDSIRLRAPLPRPGKILCCIANYWEHDQREARQLNMFLKNPDAVIGDGDTVELPDYTDPWTFQHEAELALVFRGPSKGIKQANWRDAVFGYTALIDVSARVQGRSTWRSGSWMGKSFDTFAPLGPCITTADEIPDPNSLHVQFWDNGQLRHDYNTDDMEHRVPELVEFASTIMTLKSGDVLACGTNHEGLGPLQDGDLAEIEIEHIGRMAVHVHDPLKRTWDRGIYMGADSTNQAARTARRAAHGA